MQKPVSILRRDYIESICKVTNASNLPAFIVVEVLEKVLLEVRKQEEIELKRDEALWHKACSEVKNNGSDQPISDEINTE